MEATHELKHEHDAIQLVLELAEKMILKERPDPKELRNILDFFSELIDHCHHGKEEDMLFKTLRTQGDGRLNELIQSLQAEHQDGRDLVSAMNNELGMGTTDRPVSPQFIQIFHRYADLLREHIESENSRLFPEADRLLNAQDQKTLKQAFDKHEEEEMGHGRHEEFHAMIETWQKQYR